MKISVTCAQIGLLVGSGLREPTAVRKQNRTSGSPFRSRRDPLNCRAGALLMHHWTKRLLSVAAPLLLTGCLWGPGKFTSDLALHRDGSFVLDYRGEIVVQIPKDELSPKPWTDSQAYCYVGRSPGESPTAPIVIAPPAPPPPGPPSVGKTSPAVRGIPNRSTCTPAEIAQQKEAFEKRQASTAEQKRAE